MTTAEFLKKYESVVKFMDDNHILVHDVRFLPLYEKMKDLVRGGDKVSYAASALADEYHISDRSVFSIVKRMEKEIR